MRRNVLKMLCFLFLVCLLTVGFINVPVSAADILTGKCGDNLTFALSDSGVMTISGTGKMWDFRNEPQWYEVHENPWEDARSQIKKIVFEPGITYIGADAFWYCENLEKVTFTDTITEIGSFSFLGCTKLENFTLPAKLQTLGQQAFDNCDTITSAKIPDTVTFLDGSIFAFCDALTDVYIGGTTDAGSYVFADAPFRYCLALEEIKVSPNNIALTAVDGVLYTKDLKTLVQYPAGKKDRDYTLLATTENVYPSAIETNPYVETLLLPQALKSIGNYAISECGNLKKVCYAGTEAQWAGVAIDKGNEAIDRAAVYFNSGCKHTYTNNCDAACNACNAKRTVKHAYSNACDTTCNVCNAKRTVKHTYTNACDTTCNACNAKRTVNHTYTNSCDTACNVCKAKRTIKHTYTNSCDTACNVCKAKRTIKHTYTNACDTTCNVCNAKRTTKHKYTNNCDTNCNVCNAKRTTKHKYTNNCDTTCNVCNAKRTIKHKYTNGCDKTCNVCKAKRTIKHIYSNACDKTCNECKAKRTIKHTYTNNCDTSCNVCKAKRSITHKYKTTTTKATLSKNGSVVKKCTVCDKVASNTTVKYAKSFKLSATSYTYDKKAKKPGVTVKDAAGKALKKGTDYTVSYQSGRKNVGTYKVTVKMTGKYSGTKILTFKINPAKTTVSKLTAGKESIAVAITKKSTQVTGYQIQYATSKTFSDATTETISSYKTTKYTLKSLLAKKTYYVKVRTYKEVGDTIYYSGWSAYKQVKTK